MRIAGPRLSALLCLSLVAPFVVESWEANWDSLDSRPLPAWYDEAKFGIFLHWGVFSVPSFGSEWFWNWWQGAHMKDYEEFLQKTELSRFSYTDYAHRFDATFYRPDEWADIFAKSGAQYVVLTSKHHEGFCNWDSRDVPATWNWNAMDMGPRRDLLGDLAQAVKNTTSPFTDAPIHFGVYHSLFEWFHPAFLSDKKSNFTESVFVDTKTMPELYDLVKKYEPELIWSDGEWDAHSDYWKSTEFLAWYATHSAVKDTAVWNDRWGRDSLCKHGGYMTCFDRYQPGTLQMRKWENALTIDQNSWGFNRNASYSDYLTTEYFVHQLIETVAFNGNMLLNIGPGADGTISPIFVDRLMGIGDWLKVNGDGIYATKPWFHCPNETAVHAFYTIQPRTETLYALVTQWPKNNELTLQIPEPSANTQVFMLGWDEELPWTGFVKKSQSGTRSTPNRAGLTIRVPSLTPDLVPCQHAWVFALSRIQNLSPPDIQTS